MIHSGFIVFKRGRFPLLPVRRGLGDEWLNGAMLSWQKSADGQWLLDELVTDSIKKDVCLWWSDMYGEKRVMSRYGSLITQCS